MESCHVALDKELQAIISQAPEGEEAKNGERLIQFASENLVTEVLIQPQLNTLIQCVRNLLSSFTKHRHIIHAGYTFAGNGSWLVQDGTFSLADLVDAFQEAEVQRVLRAYENSVTVDIHCTPEGDWSTARLRREGFSKLCKVRVNPDDSPSPATNIQQFVDYLAPFIRPATIEQLLEPSDVVGNIRFSHPTLYVFPGGQGDAALFGINGFNMLVDGGFARKACFWDFARHLDRLDAVLMTRINNSNINGISSVLRRKKLSHVYPQIGHFFCNLQDRKQPSTPVEEKVRDPLLVNLLDEGQEVVQNLRHLQLKPHHCVRDSVLEPINLYHKVGHGKLDMYVISPAKDSKELKEFITKWHSNDISLFSSVSKKPGDKDISFPLQNLVSICALLVWQPANPEDTITRILFPGSTPQHKIFEGLEKLRSLEFMKQPICTAKTLSPASSTIGISTKASKIKSTPAVIDKLLPGEGISKSISKNIPQTEPMTKQSIAKTATIPVSGAGEAKTKPTPPPNQKLAKPKQDKPKQDNKTEIEKNIEPETDISLKQEKPAIISEQLKEKEPLKYKTEKIKVDSKPKKESKPSSKMTEKKTQKSSSMEKKDSVKSSPTTPKKTIEAKVNGVAKPESVKSAPKPASKTKVSPSATPAKSAKEENNRKVAESKTKAPLRTVTKTAKKDDITSKPKPEKKPIKKPSTSSPIKIPSKTFSPVKAVPKTVGKQKKDPKKLKGDSEKGIITDSSTVSTPSTVDAELAILKDEKVENEEKIAEFEVKEDGVERFEEAEKLDDDMSKDVDETSETKEKLDETSLSEGKVSVDKQEGAQIGEVSEKDEEDEILIIEKVEIEQFGDDSAQEQESLESHVPDEVEDEIQKHLRDEAESEKKKDEMTLIDGVKGKELIDTVPSEKEKHDDEIQEVPSDIHDNEVTDVVPTDLALDLDKDVATEKVLTPENREQIEEEVQEIITSATDFVAKAKLEQSKESSELSAEGIGSDEQKTSGETKDLLSSPDKVNILSDKILTDEDIKQDETKDKSKDLGDAKYGAEESQPDEKFSTTIESGATTAPTLPEDERIPLDEIKEGVEEKYDKEDTKERDVGNTHGKIEQPTTLPQVSVIPGGPFDTHTTNILTRDVVKTPDEVADLPVHEEVDGVYEDEYFSREGSKSKDEQLNVIGKHSTDAKKEDKQNEIEAQVLPCKDGDQPNEIKVIVAPKEIEVKAELPKDIKSDEDELMELKMIRQKLEEEDFKPGDKGSTVSAVCEPVISESVIKDDELHQALADQQISSIDMKDIELNMNELRIEEQLIHSTLKAPEIAEVVLVTPDSAPDSPLHQLGEKKTTKEKSLTMKDLDKETSDDKNVSTDAKITVLSPTQPKEINFEHQKKEPNELSDIITGEQERSEIAGVEVNREEQITGEKLDDQSIMDEIKKDKSDDQMVVSPMALDKTDIKLDDKTEKDIESISPTDLNKQVHAVDIIKDVKENGLTPKTPPASPVLNEIGRAKDMENIEIMAKVNGISDNITTDIHSVIDTQIKYTEDKSKTPEPEEEKLKDDYETKPGHIKPEETLQEIQNKTLKQIDAGKKVELSHISIDKPKDSDEIDIETKPITVNQDKNGITVDISSTQPTETNKLQITCSKDIEIDTSNNVSLSATDSSKPLASETVVHYDIHEVTESKLKKDDEEKLNISESDIHSQDEKDKSKTTEQSSLQMLDKSDIVDSVLIKDTDVKVSDKRSMSPISPSKEDASKEEFTTIENKDIFSSQPVDLKLDSTLLDTGIKVETETETKKNDKETDDKAVILNKDICNESEHFKAVSSDTLNIETEQKQLTETVRHDISKQSSSLQIDGSKEVIEDSILKEEQDNAVISLVRAENEQKQETILDSKTSYKPEISENYKIKDEIEEKHIGPESTNKMSTDSVKIMPAKENVDKIIEKDNLYKVCESSELLIENSDLKTGLDKTQLNGEKNDMSESIKLKDEDCEASKSTDISDKVEKQDDTQLIDTKDGTPKSISPAPSEKDDHDKTLEIEEKHETVTSETPIDVKLKEKDESTYLDEKPEIKQSKEGEIKSDLQEKQDTFKSISPVPSEEIPRSVSPTSSGKDSIVKSKQSVSETIGDICIDSTIPHLDKTDEKEVISSVSDEKEFTIIRDESPFSSHEDTLKSKEDIQDFDKDEKYDIPKNISPLPTTIIKHELLKDEEPDKLFEKQDLMKSVSADPATVTSTDKREPSKKQELYETPPLDDSDAKESTSVKKDSYVERAEDESESPKTTTSLLLDEHRSNLTDTAQAKQFHEIPETIDNINQILNEKASEMQHQMDKTISDKDNKLHLEKEISPSFSGKPQSEDMEKDQENVLINKIESLKDAEIIEKDITKTFDQNDVKQSDNEKQSIQQSVPPAIKDRDEIIGDEKNKNVDEHFDLHVDISSRSEIKTSKPADDSESDSKASTSTLSVYDKSILKDEEKLSEEKEIRPKTVSPDVDKTYELEKSEEKIQKELTDDDKILPEKEICMGKDSDSFDKPVASNLQEKEKQCDENITEKQIDKILDASEKDTEQVDKTDKDDHDHKQKDETINIKTSGTESLPIDKPFEQTSVKKDKEYSNLELKKIDDYKSEDNIIIIHSSSSSMPTADISSAPADADNKKLQMEHHDDKVKDENKSTSSTSMSPIPSESGTLQLEHDGNCRLKDETEVTGSKSPTPQVTGVAGESSSALSESDHCDLQKEKYDDHSSISDTESKSPKQDSHLPADIGSESIPVSVVKDSSELKLISIDPHESVDKNKTISPNDAISLQTNVSHEATTNLPDIEKETLDDQKSIDDIKNISPKISSPSPSDMIPVLGLATNDKDVCISSSSHLPNNVVSGLGSDDQSYVELPKEKQSDTEEKNKKESISSKMSDKSTDEEELKKGPFETTSEKSAVSTNDTAILHVEATEKADIESSEKQKVLEKSEAQKDSDSMFSGDSFVSKKDEDVTEHTQLEQQTTDDIKSDKNIFTQNLPQNRMDTELQEDTVIDRLDNVKKEDDGSNIQTKQNEMFEITADVKFKDDILTSEQCIALDKIQSIDNQQEKKPDIEGSMDSKESLSAKISSDKVLEPKDSEIQSSFHEVTSGSIKTEKQDDSREYVPFSSDNGLELEDELDSKFEKLDKVTGIVELTSNSLITKQAQIDQQYGKIIDTTEKVTSAVIEQMLDNKDIKTVEEPTSTVPSRPSSFGVEPLDRVSSVGDSYVIGDSKLKNVVSEVTDNEELEREKFSSEVEKTEQTTSKPIEKVTNDNITKTADELESSSEELASSVHRMLVTGSSEDGGTETELCSSSVTKLTSDSSGKQLGNVCHLSSTKSPDFADSETNLTSSTKDDSTLSNIVDTQTSETTVITTSHILSNDQRKLDSIEGPKHDEVVKTITKTITKTFEDPLVTEKKTTEEHTQQKSQSQPQGVSGLESLKPTKPTTEGVSTGILGQSVKKEFGDAFRSSTPASDMASEREFETGGPSTPHSDISSGQVSRAATHVWGESSEGRPDSRHYDSDEDIPCSPMSATSHIAQSPPQFDFDIHQHSKEEFDEDSSKPKTISMPSAMTSSLYGSLPEEDPLEDYIKSKKEMEESEMYSSMYVSQYKEDESDVSIKSFQVESKGQAETKFSAKKEDIDFETAVKEHMSVRGDDLTAKYTNGKLEKTEINGKSTHSEELHTGLGHEPQINGKSSQPESLEYDKSLATSSVSSSSIPVKPISSNLSEDQSSLSSSSTKPVSDEKKDPIEGWGKPLGLPPPPKNLIDSPLSRSTLTLVWNPADEWGIPLGLPSPAPPTVKKDSMNGEIDNEITPTSNKTTPKKVARRNAENLKSASNTPVGKEASNKTKHPDSPMRRTSNKDAKNKPVTPIYMDLTYVPHHGNSHYTSVDFFKRIRARYYVFSGTEPSREVFNALLEAKQTWEDKDLEVTIIPTYDTDTLGYWVAENEDILAKYKIDLSPSASRCTINLQDHETSCSAYRLEF